MRWANTGFKRPYLSRSFILDINVVASNIIFVLLSNLLILGFYVSSNFEKLFYLNFLLHRLTSLNTTER